ncbi:hypothetical protein AX14_011808, partial [Amanita brunnescens Koide BX004]
SPDAVSLGPSPRRTSNAESACDGDIPPTTAHRSPPGAIPALGTMKVVRTKPPSKPTRSTISSNAPTVSANTGPHPALARFTGPASIRRSSPSSRKQDLPGLERPAAQDTASPENSGSLTTWSRITRIPPLTTMGSTEPLL